MAKVSIRTKNPQGLQLKGSLKGELVAFYEVGLYQRGVADNTRYRYRAPLLRYQDYLRGKPPSLQASIDFLVHMRKSGAAFSTLKVYRAALSLFHEWRGERLEFKVKVPRKPPPYIASDRVENLLDQARGDPPLWVALGLMAFGGLRVSEAADLRFSDVNLSNNSLRVVGKGDKTRIILMPRRLHTMLDVIPHGKPEDKLIGYSANRLYRKTKRLAPDMSPHDLRHAFLTRLVERKADIRAVQELAGHTNLSTTSAYIGLSPTSLQQTIDLLDETAPPVEATTGADTVPKTPAREEGVSAKEGHAKQVQGLAQRLRAELRLPSTWEVFSGAVRGQHHSTDNLSWNVLEDGVAIELSWNIEGDTEVEHPLRSLLSHLATSGFASVRDEIEEWKQRLAHYLAECYRLLARVRCDVKEMTGAEVPQRYKVEPGITAWFPLTICLEAVEKATSFEAVEYVHDAAQGGLYGLWFTSCMIAAASSEDERDRYEKIHSKLRDRHACSPEGRDIAKFYEELQEVERRISSQLQKFSLTVHLPGHCDLCRPE